MENTIIGGVHIGLYGEIAHQQRIKIAAGIKIIAAAIEAARATELAQYRRSTHIEQRLPGDRIGEFGQMPDGRIAIPPDLGRLLTVRRKAIAVIEKDRLIPAHQSV